MEWMVLITINLFNTGIFLFLTFQGTGVRD